MDGWQTRLVCWFFVCWYWKSGINKHEKCSTLSAMRCSSGIQVLKRIYGGCDIHLESTRRQCVGFICSRACKKLYCRNGLTVQKVEHKRANIMIYDVGTVKVLTASPDCKHFASSICKCVPNIIFDLNTTCLITVLTQSSFATFSFIDNVHIVAFWNGSKEKVGNTSWRNEKGNQAPEYVLPIVRKRKRNARQIRALKCFKKNASTCWPTCCELKGPHFAHFLLSTNYIPQKQKRFKDYKEIASFLSSIKWNITVFS